MQTHTGYVSTRWYRAPEIIMRQGQYDGKVDIFALGCIMAELYTGVPLLPGTSEDDMLYKLSNLLG
jgi:protein kinase